MSEIAWWGWLLAVAAGSTASVLRAWLVHRLATRPLPIGVLVANVTASAVGGAVVGDRVALGPTWSLVVIGGVCGGLSTLSTLAVDTVLIWREGLRVAAVGNVVVNVVLGLAAAWGAWALVS